ncbi:TetR/AcrR family transcriptional regulator [Gordonia sp. Z-3]|uniref:TetR/AcrR family transcriptional regulator n=1 Tax=Gordonia aquimaris TaxID=2984863 RepID=A0A9X3D8J6_9ACTN|nr:MULTISPECIES: TetR/AcrR family transcriptional regulator [Gordonia]MCX2966790.1 TetR/AcrR family transcriptional regulator [Gordonia aquimaris]MED5803308.1 TetR/AcrR family transcriptional regulator [Gordonia sp. Z-3]
MKPGQAAATPGIQSPPQSPSLLQRAYVAVVGGDFDEPDDPTRARLLDAAFDQFCRMGIQRSSMDEVARRAGLSRVTIYRKFDTKDALVEQVILREFRRYFLRFLADIGEADTAEERVVFGFVSSLRSILGNPLIGGLIETEPTLLAGSIGADDGRMLAAVRQFLAQQLRKEQLAGNIAADLDTELTAEMMVRFSNSFLTVPSQLVDVHDDEQLAAIARQYLVPMLNPPKP